MTKTSTMRSAEGATSETDSLPRIGAGELLRVLHMLADTSETTLENIRIRLCLSKGVRRSGDALFSKARDAAIELDRLGFLKGGPYPKDRRLYERAKNNRLELTSDGRQLIDTFARSRAEAYDELFRKLYATHRYLRLFVRQIAEGELRVPTITSIEQDISARYTRNAILAEDVAAKRFDLDALIAQTGRRLNRSLTSEEEAKVRTSIARLVEDAAVSAAAEEPTEFSRKFLLRLNDILLPIIFEDIGLSFDYRTHRALWDLGHEFRLWWGTPVHPDCDGWLILRTATLRPSPELGPTLEFIFDSGLEAIRPDFLARLYTAYIELQRREGSTYVPAYKLRAVFCRNNRCQGSVFNTLFDQQFIGDKGFEIHTEIRRQWPKHEEPLRAGQRNIGTVRVVRK